MTSRKPGWPALATSLCVFVGIVGCPGPAQTPPPQILASAPPEPQADVPPDFSKKAVLAGRVRRDVSGDPVSDAVLRVSPGNLQARVEPDGHFRLPGLPVGRITLTVTAPGLAQAVHSLVIQEGEQLIDLVVGGRFSAHASAIGTVSGSQADRGPVAGEVAVILGGGFGAEPGMVIIDGMPMTLRSWADDRIEVILDARRLKGGMAEWVVRRADGQEMRRSIPIEGPGDASDQAAPPPPAGPVVSEGPWAMRVLSTDIPRDGRYESDFASTTTGRVPPEWVDPLRDLDGRPSWLYPGRWYVDHAPGGLLSGMQVLRQVETAPQPYFTMRRYAGKDFGTNDGALPPQYTVTARLQAGDSPYYKSPVGEVALLVYYKDPGNYVQLVLERQHIALYEAVNAKPLESSGWKGYVWYPVMTLNGDAHVVGARVDTVAGRITPVIDGQAYGGVTIANMRQGGRHYVAVRSIGNDMSVGSVRITSGIEAPPTPSPTPTATPSPTPKPSATPSPTPTPLPTLTPLPTPTPIPTASSQPSPSPSAAAP